MLYLTILFYPILYYAKLYCTISLSISSSLTSSLILFIAFQCCRLLTVLNMWPIHTLAPSGVSIPHTTSRIASSTGKIISSDATEIIGFLHVMLIDLYAVQFVRVEVIVKWVKLTSPNS